MSLDLSAPTVQKLLGFLAAGVPPSAAASAAGVDPSYVSQLLDTDSFKLALYERSAERLEKDVQHDTKIETVEAKALQAIEQKLPFVRSSIEAAKIFQILNNSKKRAVTGSSGQMDGSLGSVTITLPRAVTKSIELRVNTQQQVIEVEGRTMAPLPSRNLPDILAARNTRLLEASEQKKVEAAMQLQKQQTADSARAEELLEVATPMRTMIGGVVRVL